MDVRQVTDYVFLEDDDIRGDLAFVFGTRKAWEESVTKAAELYSAGFVPKVLVSGGVNPTSGVVEGDLMAVELEHLGVSRQDILVENLATNTLENVLFSWPIIVEVLGSEQIRVIAAVVKNYHARRALMTLRKHVPSHVVLRSAPYVCACYPYYQG